MTAELVSLACLLITGSIASWAVFSQHYDDTLIQRAGLSVVAMTCFARAYERLAYEVPAPPPILLLSQIGLCLYAIGTAWRVWQAASSRHVDRRRHPHRRGSAA